jgi:hypothetical protein
MTTTDTKPLKSADSHACLKNEEHMQAMLKALRATGYFEITEDQEAGTVEAYYKAKSGKREVLAAVRKGAPGQPWITRHHKQLFA